MSANGTTTPILEIDDERSFRHVALYADLKEILRRDLQSEMDQWRHALEEKDEQIEDAKEAGFAG